MPGGLPRADYLTPEPEGLIDRWKAPSDTSATYAAAVKGSVVQVLWADLQPTAGGEVVMTAPTWSGNSVLSGLTLQQRVTTALATGELLRLRVMCGYRAPGWVKGIGGTPMSWEDSTAPGVTVGRWWHPDYIAAYAALQVKLAALFDSHVAIGDVVISGAGTIFTEPMIRQASETTVRTSLLSTAGETYPYSKTVDVAAIKASIDAHDVWRHTVSSLACNPYQYVVSLASAPSSDVTTAKELATYCRATLGRRGAIGNHSMRDNQQAAGQGGDLDAYNTLLFADLYPHMAALGAPFYIQTDAVSRLGRIASATPTALTTVNGQLGGPALDQALHFGATCVELPIGYNTGTATTAFTSVSQAQAYTDALHAKPRWSGVYTA
jgi:hypothetical protein